MPTPSNNQAFAVALRDFLMQLSHEAGESEALVKTPGRFIKQMQESLAGYQDDPKKHLTLFASEDYQELVVVSGIRFSSVCEHHLLPFFGKVDIGYVPNQYILGLSKFARIIDSFAKRLQVQERLTTQLADFLETNLQPKLLLVRITAQHTCMISRGVSRPESQTKTFLVRGDRAAQQTFIAQFDSQTS